LAQLDLALAHTGDVEQIVDQSHEVTQLAIHHVSDLGGRLRVRIFLQSVETGAKRRQGITQFVREGREELVLAPVGLLQRLRADGKLIALRRDLLALEIKLQEHLSLAAQDIRLDRLLDEVHGARLVPAEASLVVRAAGGEKYNWDAARPFIAAHELGQLEAAE